MNSFEFVNWMVEPQDPPELREYALSMALMKNRLIPRSFSKPLAIRPKRMRARYCAD